MKILSFLGICFLSTTLASFPPLKSEEISPTKGYFATQGIENELLLFEQPSKETIEDFITFKVPNRFDPELPTEVLADKILMISECFALDANVFTGLIYQESSFNRQAVSPTGAAGLTQFTSAGLQEVHDQLGQRGNNYARRSTIKHLNKVLKYCVLPEINEEEWYHLWEVADSYWQCKEHMKQHPDYALVYGAVLLKVLLTVFKTDDMYETYQNALVRYNGDPAEQYHYQAKVLGYAEDIAEFNRTIPIK